MKLFLVRSKAAIFDLFIHATSEREAAEVWQAHWSNEKLVVSKGRTLKVTDLSQTALCPCVLDVAACPVTYVTVPAP